MAPGKKMSIHMNPKPIDIIFQNLTYTVSYGKFKSERKSILKGVSGHFKSGELTAIMGPSGAGKSSLLNILTGFHENGVGGCITTTNQTNNNKKKNGLDCRDSCYILQDDQLCPLFTVHEIMTMAADLKLGPSVSKESKLYLIEGILTTMGLSNTKVTRCVRLSGGQKKRLSIALELIDNPPVMFLDEPTTGLDSSSCTQSVATLRRLAKGGRTIVCTIHQPSASVFEMFDHVYVIADGLCAYQGSSYNVIPYLQTIGLHCPQYHNPADFVLEVVNGEYGHFTSQLVAIANDPCWRSNSQHTKTTLAVPGECDEFGMGNGIQKFSELFSAPSELYRFFILSRKCAVKLYRDWTVSHLKVALHFLVGIFIGLLYSDCGTDATKSIYNVGFLIVSLVYLSYTSLMPAILKFPTELNVIRKEQFNNWYKLKTFYMAFLSVNIPVQMIFTAIYAVFAYYLSSQVLVYWRFLKFLLVCMLTTLINEGFGLFLGTSLSPVNGVFMGAVLICFFILFAGYVVLFAHMPKLLYYVSYSSYFRYAFEAMVQSVYGNNRGILHCANTETYCHYKYPQKIFETLGMDENRYLDDVLMLFVFLVTFFVISFFSLRHSIRKV